MQKVLNTVIKHTGYNAAQLKAGLGHDMAMRARVTGSIYLSGLAEKNAVLHTAYADPKHLANIMDGKGDLGYASAQYAEVPQHDMEAVTKIHVKAEPVYGEAVANLGSREITGGKGTRPGSYRHELGHVIRASLGGSSYSNHNTMTKAIHAHYEEVQARVKADPSGLKAKMPHEWYEEHYGVAGRRSLDSWEENFAEHYRIYHRNIYQDMHEGGGGKMLAGYRKRHPKMAKIFDAHYTTALLHQTLEGKS
jgi:hypothetical protein